MADKNKKKYVLRLYTCVSNFTCTVRHTIYSTKAPVYTILTFLYTAINVTTKYCIIELFIA